MLDMLRWLCLRQDFSPFFTDKSLISQLLLIRLLTSGAWTPKIMCQQDDMHTIVANHDNDPLGVGEGAVSRWGCLLSNHRVRIKHRCKSHWRARLMFARHYRYQAGKWQLQDVRCHSIWALTLDFFFRATFKHWFSCGGYNILFFQTLELMDRYIARRE